MKKALPEDYRRICQVGEAGHGIDPHAVFGICPTPGDVPGVVRRRVFSGKCEE